MESAPSQHKLSLSVLCGLLLLCEQALSQVQCVTPDLCQLCTNTGSCTKCQPGTSLITNDGFNYFCILCSSNCKTCFLSQSKSTCSVCNSGYYLSPDAVPTCNNCVKGCESCRYNGTLSSGVHYAKCFSCVSGFKLDNGTCIASSSSTSSSSSKTIGGAVGGAVGGLLFIILVFAICYCCRRKPAATSVQATGVSYPQSHLSQEVGLNKKPDHFAVNGNPPPFADPRLQNPPTTQIAYNSQVPPMFAPSYPQQGYQPQTGWYAPQPPSFNPTSNRPGQLPPGFA